jgi:hypothetical protein
MAERRYENVMLSACGSRDLIEGSMAAIALILTHTARPAVVKTSRSYLFLACSTNERRQCQPRYGRAQEMYVRPHHVLYVVICHRSDGSDKVLWLRKDCAGGNVFCKIVFRTQS